MIYLSGDGYYSLAVVGESHYQSALIDIAGAYTSAGRSVRCYAVLCLEDDNPHDHNAVRVEIGGDTVGYISRQQTLVIRGILREYSPRKDERFFVDAVIRGGRVGQHYGVWLDLPLDKEEDIAETVYPLNYYEPDPLAAPSWFDDPQKQPAPPPTLHWPEETPPRTKKPQQPGSLISTISIIISVLFALWLFGSLVYFSIVQP